jgi:hypothetical protein
LPLDLALALAFQRFLLLLLAVARTVAIRSVNGQREQFSAREGQAQFHR